jgi:hypothetical protein
MVLNAKRPARNGQAFVVGYGVDVLDCADSPGGECKFWLKEIDWFDSVWLESMECCSIG